MVNMLQWNVLSYIYIYIEIKCNHILFVPQLSQCKTTAKLYMPNLNYCIWSPFHAILRVQQVPSGNWLLNMATYSGYTHYIKHGLYYENHHENSFVNVYQRVYMYMSRTWCCPEHVLVQLGLQRGRQAQGWILRRWHCFILQTRLKQKIDVTDRSEVMTSEQQAINV